MKHYENYPVRRKSKGTAYAVWFFLGLLGGHQFYLRNYGMGILYLFIGGFFGIALLIDALRLSKMVDEYNYRFARVHHHHYRGNVNTTTNNNSNNNIIINNVTINATKVETRE